MLLQLSDFGLASWASASSHITCTDVAGTFGCVICSPVPIFLLFSCTSNTHFCGSYLAPEYFMQGKVSDKVDVFAFGVVLLELLSGRKPINSTHPKDQESLVMWVSSFLCVKNCVFRIIYC